MADNHKYDAYIHGYIEKLVQIGKVEGNVTIQGASTVPRWLEERRRKKWRNLERCLHLVSQDREESRAAYAMELAICLHKTFSQTGYVRFEGMLQLSEMPAEGQRFQVYELCCHQIEFCTMANQRENQWIDTVLAIRQHGADSQGRSWTEARANGIQEIESFEKEWKLGLNLSVTTRFLPVEFIYDPSAKRVIVETSTRLSANPDHYPNRVTTTSEALHYIASMANGSIGVFDDIFNPSKLNYPLLGLVFSAHDEGLTLDNFVINADNYEEWDYTNPIFDNELRGAFQKQAKTFQGRGAA